MLLGGVGLSGGRRANRPDVLIPGFLAERSTNRSTLLLYDASLVLYGFRLPHFLDKLLDCES